MVYGDVKQNDGTILIIIEVECTLKVISLDNNDVATIKYLW